MPTTPPDASKITVSVPNVDGQAVITGAAGAVPANATVALVNLSSRNVMTTTANSNGAFSANLFAPPGSSLLVKYEIGGWRIPQFWLDSQLATQPDVSYMNPLPGTILSVGDLPPAGETLQPFHSAGYFGSSEGDEWAGWWLSGQMVSLASGQGDSGLAGESATVSGVMHITSPALNCTAPLTFTTHAYFHLSYLFDGEGRSEPWGIWFNAHLFTPTGLPIEHESGGESRQVTMADVTNLTCLSQHTFEGHFSTTFTVPADLPDGIYRLGAYIHHGGVPLATGIPHTNIWYHADPIATLAPLTIGTPLPPHIPWTLFGDYPVNGHRGIQAMEDVGHYDMPTRVVFPPHRAVIPMLNERSGEPIIYRLEPGSHWLSATDRRSPNPPHISLALPGGELVVEVHQPDGSTEILGPALVRQSSVRTPTTPDGGPIAEGTGHIGDLYHLYTGDETFAYQFDQYGLHLITLGGYLHDIYGNTYPIEATYEVMVARVLDLDPAQLPTTPYQQGDAFAPGLHVFPPVPAEVEIHLTHMPYSDPGQAVEHSVGGQANRFGYFQPPAGTQIRLNAPGEFRVDISATYLAPDGTLWAGYMTWGNVVQGNNPLIEAHGRRGMDYQSNTINDMPPWFLNENLPPDKIGIENYYPYFSGDIHWGDEQANPAYKGDSIHSIITLRDLTGPAETIYDLIRAHFPRARNPYRWPPVEVSLTGLEKRLEIGEAPLFLTTASGMDPAVVPEDIDMWGYWYGSSERPDVRVREILSEDGMGTAYWRFNDTYGYQIGESADGDQPGDIKWEFGGIVFRVPGQGINEYAIYSSLWVLLPHGCDAYGCARVTPPFQDATGAGINGGPIMTLLGQDVDMLFLPKGVRPGDVLEMGDVVAFSGHVGPPMDSRVEVTITSPSGAVRSRTWHANRVGWLYDPTFDFVADEPGRWTVDVFVEHDRPYIGNGVIPQSHNSGTVLGTSGQYTFYVVEPASPRLFVLEPSPGYINWPAGHIEPILIRGVAPVGTELIFYTIHDKGVVMGQGSLTPGADGFFTLTYDPVDLHNDFPMLSLTAREGHYEGLADEVAINLLAVSGGSAVAANTVTLIGEEVFIGNTVHRIALPVILLRQ